jgi:DNA-binding CsgD family transcriptional regulator
MTTVVETRTPGGRLGASTLVGRELELAGLESVRAALRAGHSTALVMLGEAGVGKTALLDHLREQMTECCVAHLSAARVETDLPYSTLDQVCQPLTDYVDALPGPHRAALNAAFGMTEATATDRLLLGGAVLNLLAEASAERPVVCLIDDAQWVDDASAAVLAFAARRLGDHPVALVFAARTEHPALAGLPEMVLGGLSDSDARRLLARALHLPVDGRVRERIIVEASGNPTTLLAVARAATSRFAGGFGDLDVASPDDDQDALLSRTLDFPEDTRMVLVIAAAEPTGDSLLLWSAADKLGIPASAADDARSSGLVSIGAQVRFRDPLVRGAVYRSALAEERRLAHCALAAATDGGSDPELQAWHRAGAAAEPDEQVAAELEQSAGRAGVCGGMAASAAFLRQAATLTPGPEARGRRALAAAEATRLAGDRDAASRVLVTAEAAPMDAASRARTHLLRARLATGAGGAEVASSLLAAARQLEPLDARRAREAYLDALAATVVLGEHAGARPTQIARAALALGTPDNPRPVDLLLEGLSRQVVEGAAAAIGTLRDALVAFDADDVPPAAGFGWGWLASYVAAAIWDHDAHLSLATRHVRVARSEGAIATLPLTLAQLAAIDLREGRLTEAALLISEADAVARTACGEPPTHLTMLLAAYEGRETDVLPVIEASRRRPGHQLGGIGASLAHFAGALLYNGLSRYNEAFNEARSALVDPEPVAGPAWVLPELVEAATRTGAWEDAVVALERLSTRAQVCGTEWALGLEARSRALMSAGVEAERLYREAITRLSGAGSRVDLARAHLLYGEWLRREGRRVDSRKQLRLAEDFLNEMGIAAFAERARRELRATGELRRGTDEARDELTAQEMQIAGLARSGLSNPQIGAQLFLSPRTVEWHLRKVFAKLDLSSRRELATALPVADVSGKLMSV